MRLLYTALIDFILIFIVRENCLNEKMLTKSIAIPFGQI